MTISTPNKELMKKCFKQETLLKQYNSEGFEGFPDLSPLPPPYDWANFLVYRSKDDGVDLDVSPVAMWTYCLMYGWETDKICKQTEKENCHKYQIKHNGHIYRGDAMTSGWTVWRNYIEGLFKTEKYSEKRKELDGIVDFTAKGILCIPKKYSENFKNFEDYIKRRVIPEPELFEPFVAVVNELMSENAKKFCNLYLSAGNFLMVPLYFNRERSNYGKHDTADRMLWKIYQYFEAWKKMWIGCDALNQLFFSQSAPNCKQWFCDCDIITDPWKKFLEVHLLQDFVMDFEKGDLRPISFKNSTPDNKKPVEEFADKNGEYYPLPQRPPKGDFDIILTQYENFFATANDCIRKRGEKIWKKIKDKL